LIDCHTQRVNQERNVWMENENDRVSGLPAITFKVRIENGNRSLFCAALLQKLPGSQDGSISVRKPSTDKFLQRNMGIMQPGELGNFLCFGLRNLFCESISQLFEKLLFAGDCQRIHIRPLVICVKET